MNNVKTAIRRFFTNKNTVTIIGVLLGIVILYVGYNYRINSQINPTSVPYATQRIKPKTKITSEMIGTIEVPPAMLKGDPIMDSSQIVGRYANADTVIPQGSLFYKGSVVEKDELPDSIIYDYPDGYVLVNMSVNTTNTYGNKIYPGNYIDIYLKIVKQDFVTDSAGNTTTQQTEDKIMIGKLLENVQVIDVLDSNGASVFEVLEDIKTPDFPELDVTFDDLRDIGIPEEIIEALQLVTKTPPPTRFLSKQEKLNYYYQEIDTIIESKNLLAIELKTADMSDNYNPERLNELPEEKKEWFTQKYSEPLKKLTLVKERMI